IAIDAAADGDRTVHIRACETGIHGDPKDARAEALAEKAAERVIAPFGAETTRQGGVGHVERVLERENLSPHVQRTSLRAAVNRVRLLSDEDPCSTRSGNL